MAFLGIFAIESLIQVLKLHVKDEKFVYNKNKAVYLLYEDHHNYVYSKVFCEGSF